MSTRRAILAAAAVAALGGCKETDSRRKPPAQRRPVTPSRRDTEGCKENRTGTSSCWIE